MSNYSVLDLANGNYCVIEFDSSFTVECKKEKLISCNNCKSYRDTGGLCPHVLVVAEKRGKLQSFIYFYKKSNNRLGKMIKANFPKQLGGRPHQRKKSRRGSNNIRQVSIQSEVDTSDVMAPKPIRYTEYYQNDEPFFVVFIQEFKNAKKCIGCTNEFPRRMPVAPYDITLFHEERYCYPKRDDKGKVEMVATHNAKAKRFYCVDKNCILGRHPYFWRGLIQVTTQMQERLKDSHKDLLSAMLRFKVAE